MLTHIDLWNYHHKEGTVQFQQSKSSLVLLIDIQTFTSCITLDNQWSVFQHYSFAFSRMSNKRNHAVHNLLTLACLTQHNTFEFHSNCCVYHSFCLMGTISLYSVYPFILGRTFEFFPRFHYHIKLLWTFVYMFLSEHKFFISLRWSGTAGSQG